MSLLKKLIITLIISITVAHAINVTILGGAVAGGIAFTKWICDRAEAYRADRLDWALCAGSRVVAALTIVAGIIAGFITPAGIMVYDHSDVQQLFDDIHSTILPNARDGLETLSIRYHTKRGHPSYNVLLAALNTSNIQVPSEVLSFEYKGLGHTAVSFNEDTIPLVNYTAQWYAAELGDPGVVLIGAGGQCDRCPRSCKDGAAFTPNCDGTDPGTGPTGHGNEELWVSVTHDWDNRDEAVKTWDAQFDAERRRNMGYALRDSDASKLCSSWHNLDTSDYGANNAYRGEVYPGRHGGLDGQCYTWNSPII